MSLRISSAIALTMLAGCDARSGKTDTGSVNARPSMPTVGDERIACAHAGAPMVRDCRVARGTDPRGLVLTLRHPDGGFHRVLVTRDGRGIVAADGARYALATTVGTDSIEVAIDGDRYRLPAMIGTTS